MTNEPILLEPKELLEQLAAGTLRLADAGKISLQALFNAVRAKTVSSTDFSGAYDKTQERLAELKKIPALGIKETDKETYIRLWESGLIALLLKKLVLGLVDLPKTPVEAFIVCFGDIIRDTVTTTTERRNSVYQAIEAPVRGFLAEDAAVQACRERDCSGHDWASWTVSSSPDGLGFTSKLAKKMKVKGDRDRQLTVWGIVYFRLCHQVRRFCHKCGKAQTTILRNPAAVEEAKFYAIEILNQVRPPWVPEQWLEHRDVLHAYHVEERDLRYSRGYWTDTVEIHKPGEPIEYRDHQKVEEMEPLVKNMNRPDVTAAFETMKSSLEGVNFNDTENQVADPKR